MSWLRQLWRRGLRTRSPAAYGFAILLVAIATGIRWALGMLEHDILPFATYFPAILFVTLIAGVEAGALAVVLSALIGWYVFVPDFMSLQTPTRGAFINGIIFLVTATVVMWVAFAYRQMMGRLEDEEKFRALMVEELAHRVKNKLAAVYAIVGRELHSQKDIWDRVEGRLRALATADEFISKSNVGSVNLRDILKQEIAPFDPDRFSFVGPDLAVPERLAILLALIFHELATNAVKYGALSVEGGRVSLSWVAMDGRVKIDWTESGGPPVTLPLRRGFGHSLLERALEAFEGWTEPRFEPDGFACKMSFQLLADKSDEPARPERSVGTPWWRTARDDNGGTAA